MSATLPESEIQTLVADVGGSNARFGWLDGRRRVIRDVRVLPVQAHAGIAEAMTSYLSEVQQVATTAVRPPKAAAIAVATAVTEDRVEFTNSHWSFSRRELQGVLQLQRLQVLNDFEALALALPQLDGAQLRYVGPAPAARGLAARPQTMAVVGPGTGLGVATVVPTAAGWMALAGEGGHSSLAPGSEYESQLLSCVRRRFEHVSAERALSGIGLPELHAAVCELAGTTLAASLEAPAIVDAGLAGEPLACRTLEVFCALLGSFAGNVALIVGARGGLFIGGGIVPRLGEFFERSEFRRRFEAKGRLASYLADIPTAVITDTLAALTGAAAALDEPAAGSESSAASATNSL